MTSRPTIPPELEEELIARAWEAQKHGYAPYSSFKVGAAVLADNGKIYAGCNVECVSLPHSVCAELNAVSSAVADGQRKFQAIAIACNTAKATPPCGGCRQFMAEFEPDLPILLASRDSIRRTRLGVLLPELFDLSYIVDD